MSQTRVIYRSMLEALYVRLLAGKVTPDLKQRLRPLGLDLNQPLPASLPISAYARCLYITVEELYPERPTDDAMYELACGLTVALWDSRLGHAAEQLLRVLGPDRALAWLGRIFRAVDSYSEVTLVREGPRQFVVRTNATDVPPGYGRGVFETLLRVAGAVDPEVEALGNAGEGDAYRLRWNGPLDRGTEGARAGTAP